MNRQSQYGPSGAAKRVPDDRLDDRHDLRKAQIVMVGLMGAGKSAIGRRLAARLKMPFIDADAEIEAAAGCTVAEIFERHGEAAFREGERAVINRLMDGTPKVIATGGGAFLDESLRTLFKARGISVWLRAELGVLLLRTSRRSHRPILRQGDPKEILGRLIDERYPVYLQADITVDSTDKPLEEMVTSVHKALRKYCASAKGAAHVR